MSDSIRNDSNDLQVDPRLDALLGRVLGRGSVPRQQRQRHLARLGIAPRLGGSAGLWRAPVVAGRPPTSTTSQPASLPARRRRRQWLELGAAVLAVVLVASLLVALFRDWSGGEDDQQLAASPEATSPAATEAAIPSPTTVPAAHELLFAVSHSLSEGGDIEGGQVTAFDAQTGALAYAIDTGINPDAVLSPDGSRLYVVANNEDGSGDILTSYVALSGDENWSVAVENRIQWMHGEGPTTLAVSQDGKRLFVYSDEGPGDNTIQVFDTADGRLGRIIDGVTRCTAQLFPSADGRSLYVVCLAERFAPQVIDLEAWTSAGIVQGFGGIISGAAASPDGRYLYIPQDIDTEMSLSVIDMNGRVVSDMRSIIHLARDPLHALNITAISPDGSRLFIGVGSEPADGAPVASQVWAWDTAMLHAGAFQMIAPEAINGWSLAPGLDNNSVFAVHNEDGLDAGGQPSKEAVIMRLSLDDGSDEFVRYWGGKILRVFSGRVTDTPQPPSTEETTSSTWDGSLYALFHEEGNSGVVELDGMTGEVRRRINMIPYGNSYPHLEVSPEGDRLAVFASLPGEQSTLDVLIYRLSDFALLQRVPIPTLIQSFGVSDGIALSPDGRFLYAYQYEVPPDGNGDNARYWLGTYDLEGQTWLADVELSGCGTVTQIDASFSPRVLMQCSQAGLRVVETGDGTVSHRIDSGSQVAWFAALEHSLSWLTPGGSSFSGGDPTAEDYHELIASLNSPQHVPVPAGMSIATLPFARLEEPKITYVPLGPIGNDPTEIAVAEIPWSRISRTIRTSAPFREIVFSGDKQFAYVTLIGDDDFTTGIARIDLATGAETMLVEGFYGNLVAVTHAEQ